MLKNQGASRFYGFLFPPLIMIAANSNCPFSCLAGNTQPNLQRHRTPDRQRRIPVVLNAIDDALSCNHLLRGEGIAAIV